MGEPRTRWVAGCMTGTSLDGLDVVLAEIQGTGLELTARYRGMVSRPLGALRDELRHFALGQAAEPIRFVRAARRLGELHAEAVAALPLPEGEGGGDRIAHFGMANFQIGNWQSAMNGPSPLPSPSEGRGGRRLDFVVAHGQTIWHAPGEGLSWQLFDPWPIVRRLGVPVCYDLRQADLVAGGQGAPLTPLADWVLYRVPGQVAAVVNLGGIANVTVLFPEAGPEQVRGGDVGPCNLLLDGLARRLFGVAYDQDGKLAAQSMGEEGRRGAIVELVRRRLGPAGGRRSLGRENYGEEFLDEVMAVGGGGDKHLLLASAVEAVAEVVAGAVRGWSGGAGPGVVVLAGGGARNPRLVDALRYRVRPAAVLLSNDVGIPLEAREALGFAVLGALAQDGVPITLPQVTGAEQPGRAGAWVYP